MPVTAYCSSTSRRGLSSNAALQRVRRLLGGARPDTSGSLDPLATGMLPLCLGEATKIAGEILSGRKRYRFTDRARRSNRDGDREGAVVEQRRCRKAGSKRCPTRCGDSSATAGKCRPCTLR